MAHAATYTRKIAATYHAATANSCDPDTWTVLIAWAASQGMRSFRITDEARSIIAKM
jgi:hypothetical protein